MKKNNRLGFGARSTAKPLSRSFILRGFCLMLAILTAFCLYACGSSSDEPVSAQLVAMDTVMNFSVYGREAVLGDVKSLVTELEKKLSVTDEESEIFALNRDGSTKVSSEVGELIKKALELAELSGGAFDPTVYPAVRAWGFTTGEYRVPNEEELFSLLPLIDYRAVTLSEGTSSLPEGFMLDLGGIAKGYTADRIAALLRQKGVRSAIINLGGNVHTIGTKPTGENWNIAINDPNGEGYACVLSVADKAVVTSGGYERNFTENGKTYCHIIDPATARPVENGLASVTIVATSGTTADALSTALYVMGLEKAIEFYNLNDGFEAIFITESGEIHVTEGLKAVFAPKGRFETAQVNIITRQQKKPGE